MNKRRWLEELIKWGFATLLVLMNFIRIRDNDFWFDEIYTIEMIKKPSLAEVYSNIANGGDAMPPLYHIYAYIVCKIFGFNEQIYNLTGLLPYVFLVVFLVTFVWRKIGKEVAVVILIMSSTASEALYYNIEVRTYSLAFTLVFMCFCFCYMTYVENKWSYYVAMCICGLGAAFTHYYALISVAGIYIGLLVAALVLKENRWKRVIILYIITVILYLPWLSILLKSYHSLTDNYREEYKPESLRTILLYPFAGSYRYIIKILIIAVPIAIVLFLVLKKKITVKGEKEEIKIRILTILTIIFSAMSVICVELVVSVLVNPLASHRYLYPACGVIWSSLGFICCWCNKKIRRYVFSLIAIILLVIGMKTYIDDYRDMTERCQQISNTRNIISSIGESDLIYNCGIHSVIFNYYCNRDNTLYYTDVEFYDNTLNYIFISNDTDYSEQTVEELYDRFPNMQLVAENARMGGDVLFSIYKVQL